MPRMLCVNAVARPGGAEIGLRRLIERLDGWEVTLAGPDALPVGGLGRGEGARAVASFARARRLAREHDVVYLNGTVAGRLLPAVAGAARAVLHVHDLVDRLARHWRRADVLLADSAAVADRLHPLDAHVVGCPVVLGHPQAAAPPWAPDPRPVVGYVGRIEPRKGVLDLVAAAPRIDARVVLIGDDSFGADDAYRLRVAASTAVEHVGWVDDAAALMAHLDVLVLPSHAEPFGTVLAEAMAAGTPVVATAVGGLPEVVPSAQLVPPGRPDALAAKVNETLGRLDELRPEAVDLARRWDAGAYARTVESLIAP